jgi:uncharacterized protein
MTKTTLITGATSGIGTAFARELAAQGYNLGLAGRRRELLAALAAELSTEHGIQAEPVVADLANVEGQQQVVAWIEAHAPLEMLINNAGFGFLGAFAETEVERHLDMLAVHAAATLRLTRAALPEMIRAGRGTIINVSSPSSYLPLPGSSSYAATKAFLNMFSETLRAELRGTGVKVQVLLPGFTYSDFHKRDEWVKSDFYSTMPKWLWMTSEAVAQTSLRALKRGGLYCIPGLHNHVIVFLGKSGLAKLFIGLWDRLAPGKPV